MAHEDDWSEGMDYEDRSHTRGAQTGFQTGGIFDDVGDALGGAYDTVAGAADWAAGSTDEAVARTFDDEPGGGIIHGFMDAMPFMSQPDSVTERQIEQGVIDAPDGYEGGDQTQQSQDGTNGDFDRSGTPTTDNEDGSQDDGSGDEGMGDGEMKKLAMVGGAIAVGGYALTKMSSDGEGRSVPSTGRTTRREVGNGARSNRGSGSSNTNGSNNNGA